MSAINCEQVSHSFGTTTVLSGVDLSIAEGEVTALLGRSGSGKSTLLRLIAGFERLRTGQISIAGSVVSGPGQHLPTYRRRIGYVPQDAGLFPHLTVAQNVEFGLPRPRASHARVGELIDLVGCGGLGGRYPHQLSGGQQQRVALARALAIDPQVMLLDEPFAALDAAMRTTLRREVLAILRERNVTTVLVTHDQAEALSTADALGLLDGGLIRQFGTPAQLYRDPLDRTVATFLGEANILDGVAEGVAVHTCLGNLRIRREIRPGPVQVLLRPEQIRLDPPVEEGSPRWEVVSVEYFGHDILCRVAPAGAAVTDRPDAARVQTHTPLLVRAAAERDLRVGDGVQLRVEGPVTAWPAPNTEHGGASSASYTVPRTDGTAVLEIHMKEPR